MKGIVLALFILFSGVSLSAVEGFYLTASGGLCQMSDNVSAADLELNAGLAASGRVGYLFRCGLCLEGEIGYRHNHIPVVKIDGFDTDLSGYAEEWNTNLNILYRYPWLGYFWFAGVGGGLEYQKARIMGTLGSPIEAIETQPIAKLMVGVDIPISKRMEAGCAYEYVGIGDSLSSNLFMFYIRFFFDKGR